MMNREECLYKPFYCCVTLVEQYVFLPQYLDYLLYGSWSPTQYGIWVCERDLNQIYVGYFHKFCATTTLTYPAGKTSL